MKPNHENWWKWVSRGFAFQGFRKAPRFIDVGREF